MKVSGQLHIRGKSPIRQLDRRLAGSHSPSGRGLREKSHSIPETEPRSPSPLQIIILMNYTSSYIAMTHEENVLK
jgi:hypothetical protein